MSDFPLETEPYLAQLQHWPPSGRHILAQYDADSIIVYQAYNEAIAKAAIEAQNFYADSVIEAGYSFSRMSWIKTNFLWMMYRSGWASKKGQGRILAIRISRSGFNGILRNANSNDNGNVRLQWDPDHRPDGGIVDMGRRAIQLGLRGKMLKKFSNEFVENIYDITDFVLDQAKSDRKNLVTPKERIYPVPKDAEETIMAHKK